MFGDLRRFTHILFYPLLIIFLHHWYKICNWQNGAEHYSGSHRLWTRRLITAFTRALHLSLSWARLIQYLYNICGSFVHTFNFFSLEAYDRNLKIIFFNFFQQVRLCLTRLWHNILQHISPSCGLKLMGKNRRAFVHFRAAYGYVFLIIRYLNLKSEVSFDLCKARVADWYTSALVVMCFLPLCRIVFFCCCFSCIMLCTLQCTS
jgi:hypothetical protein